MDAQVVVGHVINLAIDFLDQHGNPMLEPVVVDSVPVWSDTTPETDDLVVSGDGLKAVATPIAVGVDTITATVIVDGKTFSATLSINVVGEPQVLSSIVITPTVV